MAVCNKHDVFMISDEVICGFGRLGTRFGCEKLGFTPAFALDRQDAVVGLSADRRRS